MKLCETAALQLPEKMRAGKKAVSIKSPKQNNILWSTFPSKNADQNYDVDPLKLRNIRKCSKIFNQKGNCVCL